MEKSYSMNATQLKKDFIYALPPHVKARVEYNDSPDGVLRNENNPEIGGYDYISFISKKKYTAGTELALECSFEGTGAPCIVFTNDLSGVEPFSEYGLHFEICIYCDGVNVWHIAKWPERVERPIRPTRIYFDNWKVDHANVKCKVKFGEGSITVLIEDREFTVEHSDFPSEFHVGFTACEGPCCFSKLVISES